MDVGEIQDLTDTLPEELTEEEMMAMCTSEPVPGDEEQGVEAAVPEDKLVLDHHSGLLLTSFMM